jgi:UDP-glucose 4-epimerase
MRVLVTAATASPGRELVRALLADPAVEAVLAVGHGERGALADEPRLTFASIDLTKPRAVRELIQGPGRALRIDAVVHGPLHRGSREHGRYVHAQNTEATRELLLACEGHPTIRRFVYRGTAAVYALRASEPNLLDEDTPMELDPSAPQWVRDRVEGDLTACARIGVSSLTITVLRCAEILAPECGSQLWDYLQTQTCLRPIGFDPMINLLSMADVVRAVTVTLHARRRGIFNIVGADTLPLSSVVARWGRLEVAVPGPLLAPLYRLRARAIGLEFRYDLNLRRFHFGGVVDGARAAAELGYRPARRLDWPCPARASPRRWARLP